MSYKVNDSDARTGIMLMTGRRRKALHLIAAMRPCWGKALHWIITVRPYLVHTMTSGLRIPQVVVSGATRQVNNLGSKRMAFVTSLRSRIYPMQKKHCGTYHNEVYAIRNSNIPSHARSALSTW